MAAIGWADGGRVRFHAGGKSLEGAMWGPAPEVAPTVVMLHEGLGALDLWRDFPARLAVAAGWGVFAWSRAGYGGSDPADLPRPVDYMTREAVGVLPEVLAALGFRRGILLGHSDGASIAAIHAGSIADFRVRGLVLIAPHFFTEPSGLAAIAEARREFETGGLRERMARWHDDAEATFRGWNDAWLNPAFHDWNIAEVIDYWRVPVLAIQGDADRYGTLAQLREMATRSYCPVDVTILPGCGHAPHLERPDATLEAVTDYLRRLERIEAAVPEGV
jgi:pimeloyl-ACP methyl ester carboxylesterase